VLFIIGERGGGAHGVLASPKVRQAPSFIIALGDQSPPTHIYVNNVSLYPSPRNFNGFPPRAFSKTRV